MRRPTLVRGALLVALAGYWAATTLGSEFVLSPPGVLYEIWYSAMPGLLGLALGVATALFVGRWWILLAAPAPVLVLAGLELGGHITPWHDSGPPLTRWFDSGLATYFVTSYALFYVLPVVFGVAVRKRLGRRGAATAA